MKIDKKTLRKLIRKETARELSKLLKRRKEKKYRDRIAARASMGPYGDIFEDRRRG